MQLKIKIKFLGRISIFMKKYFEKILRNDQQTYYIHK